MTAVEPTPGAIRAHFGAGSSEHARDCASVAGLFARHRGEPGVETRRRSWARLLATALGTQFADSDALFVRHTLLVWIAELVARSLSPQRSCEEVEVFDWIAGVPGGDEFLAGLARRVARFDWGAVRCDVLRCLYESVIGSETRKRLGEYYTPDWLAQTIVEAAVPEPLGVRVLDPSCGSGCFLFHLVRRYLAAAERAGWSVAERLAGVVQCVRGADLHPVAVRLARVTYLLAIGPDVLAAGGGSTRVPVALRDSLRWGEAGRPDEAVDVLVGNPPWLAYRHMSAAMQAEFRAMSEARGLWHGARVATHQDLSALFVVRAIEMHLADETGRFAFVMPGAVLDRRQFAGFRGGSYVGERAGLCASFSSPWDLRRLRPHFFPITAAVVFGARATVASAMPAAGESWEGTLPGAGGTWAEVERHVRRGSSVQRDGAGTRSPYHARFRQGASVVPRVLFMVEDFGAGPRGQVVVRSARSVHEKPPWKGLPALAGAVEREFLCRVHLGETVLPFRTREPLQAVLPVGTTGVLDRSMMEESPGLAGWWARANAAWEAHRASARLSLADQLDYHGKLSGQLPVAGERVVYAKAGMYLAAARLTDARAIVDHKLYWAAVGSREEGRFLCAILNAAVVTERVRPLMSYGKDERDIDKVVWTLPIPAFDAGVQLHGRLAELGGEAEQLVARMVPAGEHFVAQRRAIREVLAASAIGRAIEAAVIELLG